MIFLFSIWGFTTILLLLVLIAAGYYFFVMLPPSVIKAGRALGLPYQQIWKLHHLEIPLVKFTNNIDKAKRAALDIEFDDLVDFFKFYGDKVDGYVDHLIAFQSTGIKVPREVIINHYLLGGSVDKLKELRNVSSKASLNLDWPLLVMSGIPDDDLRLFVDCLIRAHKASIYLSKDQLASIDPETRARIEDTIITQKGLLNHYKARIDIERYVDAMIRARRAEIEITKEALDLHYLTDGDMMKLVTNMIKLKKAELDVDQVTLMQQKLVGGDMEKLVDALIRAKTAKLETLNIHDLIDFHLVEGEVDDYVTALDIIENSGLNISKEEITKHALSNGNIVSYVQALAMVKDSTLQISKEEIQTASINGHDVSDIVSTVISSQGKDYQMDFSFALGVSEQGEKPSDAISWSIKPRVMKVEPWPEVIAQNGIQVIPKVTVTVRGKIGNYFSNSREKVIFNRVREALITEMETFGTHEEILHNLEWISKRVLYQLQGRMEMPRIKYKPQKEIEVDIKANNDKEKRLNEESAFEILDISIYDIEIGKDIYRELRERETEFARLMSKKESEKRIAIARAEEEEAKARLIKARAKLHEGMAKAFEQGKSVSKDYLKGEIFGYGEEDERH